MDVQDYYRQVLENDWHEDSEAWAEEELLRLMEVWLEGDQAAAQSESHYVKEVQKRIPGRYIVMLQSSANEHVLDKTIALLQHAHTESEGRIRAEHISPIRSLALGFTATLNNKTVQLVSCLLYVNTSCGKMSVLIYYLPKTSCSGISYHLFHSSYSR